MTIPRRIAVVHEWIDARDGSVKTFEQIAGAFPDADLYALTRDPAVDVETAGRPIRTTWLDRPGVRDRRGVTLPLMPLAWRTQRPLTPYDVVISSHHAFAQTNRLARDGTHLVYVHSPARYVWTPELDGRGSNPLLSPARLVLRSVDRRSVRHVDGYAANSTAVAERIERFWGRRSTVIAPPVDTTFYGIPATRAPTRDFILGAGRWVPYKNLHLVIAVADRLGLPVKIAGQGPERERLQAAATRARVPVELIENPTDEQLRDLYRNAAALVFPTIEDFGIVPVEAQAAGTPVAAVGIGGARDTIVDGETGTLAPSLDVEDLVVATAATMGLAAEPCRANAARFTAERFRAQIASWVERATTSGQQG
ncbi:MAG TPA: glycosyltransferase [Mycobacteriales bacterium]|nr:glycosyltransferase [Mycobacteriales bacterium]